MIKTYGDMANQVVVRSGITTATTFITDTNIGDWVRGAYTWASAYHKWPFSEGRQSTTYTTTEEWSFEGYKADSVRFLQIAGERFNKLNFDDYQKYKEDNPSGTDKVFSDFGPIIFINTNSGVTGTLTIYGQYLPVVIDITDSTAKTIFSDRDEEGNEAIVNEALSYLKLRMRKLDEAEYHHNKAIEKLENVWKRVEDEQHAYQTKNRSMFERMDIVRGGFRDDLFRRDQF